MKTIICLLAALLLCSCTPDSYQVSQQILALPENRGCRLTQWPDDPQEFIVERTDGSVWRYRSISPWCLPTGIRSGTVQETARLLRNEDRVLPPVER